ncbi:MAG: class I SAM-dependent methyltransferase [Sulfuricella sp.]|nr:class I SAM-dependent methyltransferase [Sulfuricella sp.]
MKPLTDLPWTGERFVPGVQGETALEHLHRYALAQLLAPGKRVLDIACGEGYGSRLLAEKAVLVIGVDLDATAVIHAKEKYSLPNLKFIQGDCTSLPLDDQSIDLVVSFETLEHHSEHDAMMSELYRILSPTGVLIISTPDRQHYSDERNYSNPFHVRELYASEFRQLIQRYFAYADFYGQRVVYGSLVAPLTGKVEFTSFSGDCNRLAGSPSVMVPLYLVAVASRHTLPAIPSSLFDDTLALVLETNALRQALAETKFELNTVYGSIYWRITAPLRFLRKGIKRITGI